MYTELLNVLFPQIFRESFHEGQFFGGGAGTFMGRLAAHDEFSRTQTGCRDSSTRKVCRINFLDAWSFLQDALLFFMVLDYFSVMFDHFFMVLDYFSVMFDHFFMVLDHFSVMFDCFSMVLDHFFPVLYHFYVVFHHFSG